MRELILRFYQVANIMLIQILLQGKIFPKVNNWLNRVLLLGCHGYTKQNNENIPLKIYIWLAKTKKVYFVTNLQQIK